MLYLHRSCSQSQTRNYTSKVVQWCRNATGAFLDLEGLVVCRLLQHIYSFPAPSQQYKLILKQTPLHCSSMDSWKNAKACFINQSHGYYSKLLFYLITNFTPPFSQKCSFAVPLFSTLDCYIWDIRFSILVSIIMQLVFTMKIPKVSYQGTEEHTLIRKDIYIPSKWDNAPHFDTVVNHNTKALAHFLDFFHTHRQTSKIIAESKKVSIYVSSQ